MGKAEVKNLCSYCGLPWSYGCPLTSHQPNNITRCTAFDPSEKIRNFKKQSEDFIDCLRSIEAFCPGMDWSTTRNYVQSRRIEYEKELEKINGIIKTKKLVI